MFFSIVALVVAQPCLSQAANTTRPEAMPAVDAALQRSLETSLRQMGLRAPLDQGRLAVSLMDVTDPEKPRYAGLNDRRMMYAASLPKIAIVLAGFEAISQGMLEYNPAVKEMFTRLIRFSSNLDASRAIRAVGFDYIAKVLTSPIYRLYDPVLNGGLWIGKSYGAGGASEYWKRDPVANLSHAANSLQVARFFWLLDQGRLVNPQMSAEMKEIFSKPGIHHKFVKGLETLPGVREIYRKSGSWQDSHCDAALVEHAGHKYIAVALMKDTRGGEVLSKLIVKLDELILRSGSNGSLAGGLD
ncbi:MAG: serine hydrolase [Bryobacteraceae bacterium]